MLVGFPAFLSFDILPDGAFLTLAIISDGAPPSFAVTMTIVFMGLIVFTIVLAILLPIFRLDQLVQ